MKMIIQVGAYEAYVTSCLKRQEAKRIAKKAELAPMQIELTTINTNNQAFQQAIDDENGTRDVKVLRNDELLRVSE